MTDEQIAAIRYAEAALCAMFKETTDSRKAKEVLRALLSASIADTAGAKPVAWRWRLTAEINGKQWGPGPWEYTIYPEKFESRSIYEIEPLYAATPTHSVADAPRRFTGEQIAALRVAADALIDRYAEPIREILRNAEVADAAGASENDVARVIFSNLFPRGMCPSDWDSGAILGPNNETREQFLQAARAVIAAIAKGSGK
ncbi:hypothetical protein CBA19CS22_38100 [Caballeronia novacaledonica]|uniref:Uncharacterized protein n=1 Tax=Caballeronia novacaledonica TaxID=1544861 RepID=A0ACB5R550_9BURK|nr:hypothetical protein CBA19CS22_38100 [Caballeronia novacaledonica]